MNEGDWNFNLGGQEFDSQVCRHAQGGLLIQRPAADDSHRYYGKATECLGDNLQRDQSHTDSESAAIEFRAGFCLLQVPGYVRD